MAALTFRPARRDRRRPLIGLYALSGAGKTYSALLLARGLVGPTGRIAMIDTENGRGSDYVDVIPGGYDVLDLGEPFSPEHYSEAIDALVASKADVGIIDSGSHEWEGVGSVTAAATEIEIKSGKSGLHCWKEPKMRHTRFMLKLLRAPMPIIICLRAKRKSRQTKDKDGKTVIVKDEFATPKQDGDFIFEMTAHMEIMPDHTIRVTKLGHPKLVDVFKTGEAISIETGEKLRQWTESRPETATAAPLPSATKVETPPPGESLPSSDGVATPPEAAPSYHPDIVELHKNLREGLRASNVPETWWRNHPKGLEALKESAPALWQDLRDLAAKKKAGKKGTGTLV